VAGASFIIPYTGSHTLRTGAPYLLTFQIFDAVIFGLVTAGVCDWLGPR
jgi:hypothetical protein